MLANSYLVFFSSTSELEQRRPDTSSFPSLLEKVFGQSLTFLSLLQIVFFSIASFDVVKHVLNLCSYLLRLQFFDKITAFVEFW